MSLDRIQTQTNVGRVDKMLEIIGHLAKSARSNRASGVDFLMLLGPVLTEVKRVSGELSGNGASPAPAPAPAAPPENRSTQTGSGLPPHVQAHVARSPMSDRPFLEREFSAEELNRVRDLGVWMIQGSTPWSVQAEHRWTVINSNLVPVHTFYLKGRTAAEAYAKMLGVRIMDSPKDYYKMRRLNIQTGRLDPNAFDPLLVDYRPGPHFIKDGIVNAS